MFVSKYKKEIKIKETKMDALLPTLIIFFSLVGLIFVLFQKSNGKEKIDNKEFLKVEEIKNKKTKFALWLKKIRQTPIREIFLNFWEKFLRRLRIIILRIDRTITDKLHQIKKVQFLKEEKHKSLKSIFGKKTTKSSLDEDILEELNKLNFDNLDLKEEETRLLKEITKDFNNKELLKNLGRLYLWEGDFHSACWAFLEVYYLDNTDKIIYDLLLEIKEKSDNLEKNLDKKEQES
ncbi:MAG: tetratricopeptide repeat protein [Minisyncoccia bacterium]